jgi:hypothetical protein
MTGTVHSAEYDTGGYQGRPVYVHLDREGTMQAYTPFQDEELEPLSPKEAPGCGGKFMPGDRVRVARTILGSFGETAPGTYAIDLRGSSGTVEFVRYAERHSSPVHVRMDDEPREEVWFCFTDTDLELQWRP